MKKWGLISVVLVLGFIAVSSSGFHARQGKVSPPDASGGINQSNVKIEKDYGKIPLYFIPNQGHVDRQVYYYIQGKDKTVYFTSEGITISLTGQPGTPKPGPGDKAKPSRRWVVKLEFMGARKDVKPVCLEQSGTVISYFKGKPGEWESGIQAASKIIYRELWPGIDLVYYGTVNKMKYEFIVHPGADHSQIKLAYRGAEGVKENGRGQLEVQTPVGGFFDDTPAAWQVIDGKRETVSLKYALEKGENGKEIHGAPVVTYGFTVGQYDPKKVLVLDPAVLIYCGYMAGFGNVNGESVAVDALGCAYVTGDTNADEGSFPVTVGPDLTYNGGFRDIIVVKIKADGTGLDYCGYIGGSEYDVGSGIAVDSSGCAYVTGAAYSTATFPVKIGPDTTYNGGQSDAFVAKINAAGTGLVYCGYIGGSDYEYGYGIAVDASGCAYIAGSTNSTEPWFPVLGGLDSTYNGGTYDAFVAKIKADGTGLDYCGYIGGSGFDFSYGIAVDASGCAYVGGFTNSTETTFPVTVGPDLTHNGDYDSFVAKINADGTAFDYCGFIGGSGTDNIRGIAVDASGRAYVTGDTTSSETTFPVAVGPDLTHNGSGDAYVARVNADGTALDYCGYIGGSGGECGNDIAVDDLGSAYIGGQTTSTEASFPVSEGMDMTFNGLNDGFVARVRADGTGLVYCGYIGGDGLDRCHGIAVDTQGSAYVTGYTQSSNATFPVIVGPDLTNNGPDDAFVAKISWTNSSYTVNFAAGTGGSLTGTTSQTVMQGENCTPVEAVPDDGYYFANWTGTGSFVTTTDNPLTVTDVTSDMNITANFSNSPLGWVPVEGLQNNMIVYGQAYNGNNPASEGDWLGAFGPGGISDCRGIVAVQANGNYYITVGSNEFSGETITFKLWPLPSGPPIDSSESITFSENGVYDGFPLHFGPREQAFNLVNGWNWISFNTLPDNTSFNAVFGTSGVIEQIKSQNQGAIYTGGNWIGDLTGMNGIADGIMYKVKTNQAYAFNVTGMTVPYNTPLSLVTGWNWTAYLPTLSQPVEEAVDSILTPVSQVKSQTKSVIKIGSTLFGDLTDMEPNKGYLILMTQAGVLEYPQGESVFPVQFAKKATTKAQTVSWPVIKGNQYNMVALGNVYLEGKTVNKDGFYLGSIGPNGDNDGRSLSPVKTDGSYFATILGNTGGETVKFKLFNSKNGKTYDVAGSLVFQTDGLKTGFDLKARSVRVTAPVKGTVMRMGTTCTIRWKAYEVNNVKIELFKGGKLLSTPASSVPAGTLTYSWTIPETMTAGNNFKVRVSCTDPGVRAVGWSGAFSIEPAPSIALLSPNGGEVWLVNRSYNITWRSSGIDKVKIELYKGKKLKTVISAGTSAGTGKYTWTIPANHPHGAKYKIKISGVDDDLNPADTGDRLFTITGTGTGT